MEYLINQELLNSIMKDKDFVTELKIALNEMMNEELEKDIDQMDCDLIDECTNMLIELEQESKDGVAVIVPLLSSKKIIRKCTRSDLKSLNRGMRVSLVASLILLSCITANATMAEITGVNVAKEIASSISTKLEDWGIIKAKNTLSLDDNGIENLDAGLDDEEETTKQTTKATEPVTESTTTKGIESLDAGLDDDDETTKAITSKGIENLDAGLDDDDETTKATTSIGIENLDGGLDDDDETTTEKITEATTSTGIENLDGGLDDDDEPTTEPDTEPATEPTTELTTQPLGKSEYVITFDANGGECDVQSKVVTFRKAIGELPVPTKEGYIFDGWYNIDVSYYYPRTNFGVSVKTEKAVAKDTIFNLQKNVTLTAHWTEAVTVTFNAQGADCDVTSLRTNGEGKIPYIPIPKKEGYIFEYWYYTEKSSNGINYNTVILTEDLVIKKNVTVVPAWSEDKTDFTITFDANGGKCDVTQKPAVFGEVYGDMPTPTRDGYTFIGWYKGTNTTYAQITSDTLYTTRQDVTLYALWAQDEYTVYFDANGGNTPIDSQTAYLGNKFGTLPTPTRDGYTFDGWYYGDSKVVRSTDVPALESTKEMTLVAHWSEKEVEVSFNGNGGTVKETTKSYYYNCAYGTLPTTYNAGYAFDGWYTKEEGGTKITEDSIVDSWDSIELYAHWIEVENAVIVTVYSNRSIEEIYDLTYTAGETLGDIPIPTATTDTEKRYTKFLGWFDDKYYGNELSADTVVTEDMEIYAHWTINSSSMFYYIEFEGVKSVYELDEEFNYDDVVVKLGVYPMGYVDGFDDVVRNDDLAYEEHFEGVDTSTVGEHTLKFKASYDEFDYIGFGTLSFEGTTTYKVVGCRHSETKLVNYKAPACNATGYSGDVVCAECEYVIEAGHTLDKLPHDENTETKIVNAKEPTCTSDGYTGDVRCAVCNTTLEKGTTIEKLGHADTTLENVRETSCAKAGYTGDEVCTRCGEILVYGESIPALPHGDTVLTGVKEATCTEYGYTGNYVCEICGTVMSFGKNLPKLPHGETVVANAKEATCTEYGYTGDEVCSVCGTVITYGSVIPKTEHLETELVNVREATCTASGYTGDEVCKACGTIIEKGSIIEVLGHESVVAYERAELGKEGFVGTRCSRCGVIFNGKKIPAIATIELDSTVYAYTGSEITPNVTVYDTDRNEVTSYVVTMSSGRTEPGTYTVTITFNGNYKGQHKIDFVIETRDISIDSISKINNGFTVSWTAKEGVDGYELKAMNGSLTYKTLTITNPETTSAKFTGFRYGTETYVIIRYYTVDENGTKVYSDWSAPYYVG